MTGGKPGAEPRKKPAFDLNFFINILSLLGSLFFLIASILAFAVPARVPPGG